MTQPPYELTRDAYLQIASWISVIKARRGDVDNPQFRKAARTIDFVGSNRTVIALNAFITAAKNEHSPDELEKLYRAFFDAMRRDIRELRGLPLRERGSDANACSSIV